MVPRTTSQTIPKRKKYLAEHIWKPMRIKGGFLGPQGRRQPRQSANVTEGTPPPPPYPGRATPAHPQSRASAKPVIKLRAESVLKVWLGSLLKVCVRMSPKLYSLCAHTPDRRIYYSLLKQWAGKPLYRGGCVGGLCRWGCVGFL